MNEMTQREAEEDRFSAALTKIGQQAERLLYRAETARNSSELAAVCAEEEILRHTLDRYSRILESAWRALA